MNSSTIVGGGEASHPRTTPVNKSPTSNFVRSSVAMKNARMAN